MKSFRYPHATIVLFFLGVFTAKVSYAQPSNDECSSAITLTSSISCVNTAGTNVNATWNPSTFPGTTIGCGASDKYDVWYKFVAQSSSHTITLSSAPGNIRVQLLSGACGSFTSLACGNASLTYNSLTIGNTYYVRVYTQSTNGTGSFNICITHTPPANDNCAAATSLTSNASCVNTAATLTSATANGTTPLGCFAAGTYYDVWFSFVAANTTETVTLSGLGANITNPQIQIYGGTCAALTNLTACGSTSVTKSGLTIGSTYYIRVSNIGSNPTINGDFNICVIHPTPPPSNDDCAGATTLTSSTNCSNTAGTLVSATATTGLPIGCETGGTHYDVWYKFVASNTTHAITISGQGTNFTNAQIQLYSGTCGALTSIACGNTSLSSITLNVLSTYYIRVSNVGSNILSNGGFNICVTHPPASINVVAGRMNEVYKQTVLSGSGILQYPWEVTYGPDNNLWITESRGYKVYRMDPNTGAKTTVLDISMGSTWLPAPYDSLNVQFNSN